MDIKIKKNNKYINKNDQYISKFIVFINIKRYINTNKNINYTKKYICCKVYIIYKNNKPFDARGRKGRSCSYENVNIMNSFLLL